jgi:hypothetical protein
VIDPALRELALKYVLAQQSGDALTYPTDPILREMISGFGEVDTNTAIEEMREIVSILCPPPFTTIKWYTGIAIKDMRSLLNQEPIP